MKKIIYVAESKELRIRTETIEHPFGIPPLKVRPKRLKSYNPVMWESAEMKELKEREQSQAKMEPIPEKNGKCVIL
jgi:hypothetical protein